jgi:hypothetical protein
MSKAIPNRLIFIWLGSRFPLANRIAIKSAIACCKPDETLLIQKGLNSETEGVKELIEEYGVVLADADDSCFNEIPIAKEIMIKLYNELGSPASKANLLRMASLYKLGGIYIDMDTICLKSFDDLRHLQGFCGTETVALPGDLFHSKNPFRWIAAGVRLALREVCVRIPFGFSIFRFFEPLYPQAVNNAVIGSAPGNPFWLEVFKAIEAMPEEEQTKRFRLGTHLMQKMTKNRTVDGMNVFDHKLFYPLGPEISAFWFKGKYGSHLNKLVYPETLLIHWYNSVEKRFLKEEISEKFFAKLPDSPFARLSKKYL